MKRTTLLIILALFTCHISTLGQTLKDYYNPLEFTDIKGKEMTIVSSYDELDMFYDEILDTVWIKQVKKPILNKHFRLTHLPYKAKKSEFFTSSYCTPREAVEGRTFYVQDVLFDDATKKYVLKLKDVSSGEIISMKVSKSDTYYVLHVKVRDAQVSAELLGKSFVNSKSHEYVTVTDCYYEFKSLSFGWRITDREGLTVKFDNGETSMTEYASNYINPEKYEKDKREAELKELESDANYGTYVLSFNGITKPKSSKVSKGKLIADADTNLALYVDNQISLTIIPEDDCFRINLKNLTQSTININWDDIIYIDEKSESQRVVHSGIRYIDVNAPQTPTKIAKNSVLNDVLIPAHRVFYGGVENILYRRSVKSLHTEGTLVYLILPVEINGISHEYTITYQIKWAWKYPEKRKKWLEMQSTKQYDK